MQDTDIEQATYRPDLFLWAVFHCLVESAIVMRYGPTDEG